MMKVPIEEKQVELVVKKSRFIAIAKPISTLDEIKGIVASVRQIHSGANHVVHAAVVGTQFSSSDDHEPKNTAGRPALVVLKGSGITNILVMIVRYFGGTLLGTGGLVKAYSDSTKLVLDGLKTEEQIEKCNFTVVLSYDLYDSLKRQLLLCNATDLEEKFAEDISVSGTIAVSYKDSLSQAISDLSNGKRSITFF